MNKLSCPLHVHLRVSPYLAYRLYIPLLVAYVCPGLHTWARTLGIWPGCVGLSYVQAQHVREVA